MVQSKICVLLLVCTVGVRSWQDSAGISQKHSDEATEYFKEKYSEKYNDAAESTCKEPVVLKEERESSSGESGTHDEADCATLGSDEADQSDLLMLGQEDHKFSMEDTNAAPEDCPQHTSETNTCMPSDSPVSLDKVEHHDQFVSKSDDVMRDGHQPSLTEGENEMSVDNGNRDLPVINASASKEPVKEESDPEQENVPLREILLKLKPEGLTDDEDEQSSDYSASESSMGDESEVEEEALVSSGSPEKQEQNLDGNGTQGATEGSNGSNSGGSKKAVCAELNVTDAITDVQIINATVLLKLLQVDPNVTSRSSIGPCHLIYFFSPYCPFSIMGSPYVNALARSLPNIPIYGLDSIEHHSVNARYGVMGTPTLLLFHNGNGVGRYNASEYSVSQLMSFIKHYTDQDLNNINVTSSDFRANLPSQVAEARPYALWAAWIFLLSFASWLFLTSELCARLTEAVLNNWREAEAQNDHQD